MIFFFFAGSGTTGHAVLDLNRDDNGSREFILCTKEIDNNNNIAVDICYERLYRINKGESTHGLIDFEWAKTNEPYFNSLTVYWLKDLNVSGSNDNFLNEINFSTYNELNKDLALNKQNAFIKLHPLLNHLKNR